MKSNSNTLLEFFIYGSTPLSAGYSILGESPGVDEAMRQELVALCENYDQQSYSTPDTPMSFAMEKLSSEQRVLVEVFGGWRDQVGRPSRIFRLTLISPAAWQQVAGNPFVIAPLLGKIKNSLPRKRDEITALPALDLAQVKARWWQQAWYREARFFLRHLGRLQPEEKTLLRGIHYRLQQGQEVDLAVEEDKTAWCRFLVFALPIEYRQDLTCHSFILHEREKEGICFRYKPYHPQNTHPPFPPHDGEINRLETLYDSLPPTFRQEIFEQLLQATRKKISRSWGFLYLLILVVVATLLYGQWPAVYNYSALAVGAVLPLALLQWHKKVLREQSLESQAPYEE